MGNSVEKFNKIKSLTPDKAWVNQIFKNKMLFQLNLILNSDFQIGGQALYENYLVYDDGTKPSASE